MLVLNDDLISAQYNQPIKRCDPTAHAEILCLREAAAAMSNYRLAPSTKLYVTLEPCWMCIAACVHARVDYVCFGASDAAKGVLSTGKFDQAAFNHSFEWRSGIEEAACSNMLRDFFKQRRQI